MTATLAGAPAEVAERARPRTRAGLIVVGVAAAGLVGVRLWGLAIVRAATGDVALGAVPFFGAWDVEFTWRVLVPCAAGAIAIALLPALAATRPWRVALGVAAVGVVVWSVALTVVDRPADAWHSIETDYGHHTALVHQQGYGAFLRDYVARQYEDDRPTHLRAHPPGLVLLLAAADDAGVRGVTRDIVLAFLGAAAAAVAAVVVLDELAGRALARRALPFVVLAPAAVWHANADAFYAGVALVAVALVVRSTGRGRHRDAVAAAGGVAFGAGLLLTYGVLPLALPVLAVGLKRRAARPLAIAAAATVAVVAVPALWGYSWLAGLIATRHAYVTTVARLRPYPYFLVANALVFASALGPAVLVGLTRLRDRAVWLAVGAGLAVVALADLSGMSKAETERIWQPFVPLVLLAGLALARPRRWLALQAATALVLAVCLRSPW